MALHMNLAPTPKPTIRDIEQTVQNGLEALRGAPLNEQITAALKFLTPSGYRPIAQLEEDGRKKRSTADASNWTPETGEIVIYFERAESAPALVTMTNPPIEPQSGTTSAGWQSADQVEPSWTDSEEVTSEQVQQCCAALAEAEKAGKAFIALRWFRDSELTARGYSWAGSLAHRQSILSRAIEVGAVLTASIPNPKAPQHPTTTIKLNRESEYARAVAPRYQPIRAKGGASASEIILRDRERF